MSTDFPTSVDSFTVWDGADHFQNEIINDIQDSLEAAQAKLGIGSESDMHTLVYNFFATGRKMWIHNSAAPTGWSTVAVGDRVLAVKGGATYTTGGATAEGATFDAMEAHVHSNAHTHTVGNHYHWLHDYRGATHGWTFNSAGAAISYTRMPFANFMDGIVCNGSLVPEMDLYCRYSGAKTSSGVNVANLSASNMSEARPQALIGLVITKA